MLHGRRWTDAAAQLMTVAFCVDILRLLDQQDAARPCWLFQYPIIRLADGSPEAMQVAAANRCWEIANAGKTRCVCLTPRHGVFAEGFRISDIRVEGLQHHRQYRLQRYLPQTR